MPRGAPPAHVPLLLTSRPRGHYEDLERSEGDEAIPQSLACGTGAGKHGEIAALPLVARNDERMQ
jgi:hypothetical protein